MKKTFLFAFMAGAIALTSCDKLDQIPDIISPTDSNELKDSIDFEYLGIEGCWSTKIGIVEYNYFFTDYDELFVYKEGEELPEIEGKYSFKNGELKIDAPDFCGTSISVSLISFDESDEKMNVNVALDICDVFLGATSLERCDDECELLDEEWDEDEIKDDWDLEDWVDEITDTSWVDLDSLEWIEE